MSPRWTWCVCHLVIVGFFYLQACHALKFFPPPSTVYLGTVVRIAWTFGPSDPPHFNIDAQCLNTPATPRYNTTTANGETFVALPSGFFFDFSIPCQLEGRTQDLAETLLDSKPFTLVIKDASAASQSWSSITPAGPPATQPAPPTKGAPTNAPSIPATQTGPMSTVITNPSASASAPVDSTKPTDSIIGNTTASQNKSSALSETIPSNTTTAAPTAQGQTQTSVPPPINSQKNIPTGAIVGSSLGAMALLILLLVLFILYRRRKQKSQYQSVVPLAYNESYSQPDVRSGRLTDVMAEKAMRRTELATRTDQEPTPASSSGSHSASSVSDLSESYAATESDGSTEQRLRQVVLRMSERILALEAQNGAPLAPGGWTPGDPIDENPPDYYVNGRERDSSAPMPVLAPATVPASATVTPFLHLEPLNESSPKGLRKLV